MADKAMNAPLTPTEPAATPQLQRLGVAAADELRKTVRSALTQVFGNFLKKLPEALQASAAKATNPADRTALTDLARTLPQRADQWVVTFAHQVDSRLLGGSDAAQSGESGLSADDSVAVAGVELRAEERYQKLITELDARFNKMRLMLYIPVYPKAMAPAGLCRALQETADVVKFPVRQRRLLLEKFDAIVVPELEQVYRAVIEALAKIGSAAAKAAAESPVKKPAAKVAPRTTETPTTIKPPSDTKNMDVATRDMLEEFALKPDSGSGYSDSLLAADLLALGEGKPLPGVAQDQSWVPMQRISLAGHFLNVVISDAMVPDELKPQHESVRFPLMKSA